MELHEEESGAMKIDMKIGGKWRAGGREEPSGVLMSLKTGVCCEAPHYSQNGAHTRSLHPINPSRHSGPNSGLQGECCVDVFHRRIVMLRENKEFQMCF